MKFLLQVGAFLFGAVVIIILFLMSLWAIGACGLLPWPFGCAV